MARPAYSATTLRLILSASTPPDLDIVVAGMARTAGWTAPELVRLTPAPSGMLEFELSATPPPATVIVAQLFSPIYAATSLTATVPSKFWGPGQPLAGGAGGQPDQRRLDRPAAEGAGLRRRVRAPGQLRQ